MARRAEIVRRSLPVDYGRYATGVLGFDYDGLLADTGYDVPAARAVQRLTAVGETPLVELGNVTDLVRAVAPAGKGARIFVKDEAANPSGSFKDRRAALSVHLAKDAGYEGVATATSGNYGAAVASQAAKAGLRCIVVQEAFDSRGVAQPEIAEKTRACEAYGAEVVRLSVGPELFYVFLRVLEETGYFNASLYTPFSILGIASRPDIVDQRSRFGDWEADTVQGATGSGGVASHVERKSRTAKLADKRAATFAEQTIRLFRRVPRRCRHTLTADNGQEFGQGIRPLQADRTANRPRRLLRRSLRSLAARLERKHQRPAPPVPAEGHRLQDRLNRPA